MNYSTLRTPSKLTFAFIFIFNIFLSRVSFSETGTTAPPNFGMKKSIPFHTLKKNFKEPDMIYAPFTFWFWDCPLENAKAAEMARAMTRQHLNPGYAHGRMCMVGEPDLPREQWLSELWFDKFGKALKEAEKAGCYLGYCDEYWWPSGRAADRVLKNNPDLWAVSLKCKTFDMEGGTIIKLPGSFFTIAAQYVSRSETYEVANKVKTRIKPHSPAIILSNTLKIIGTGNSFTWETPGSITTSKTSHTPDAPDTPHTPDAPHTPGAPGAPGIAIPTKWRIYSFTKYYHPGVDGGRLNYLDKRVAKAFIALAHKPYADHFDGRMGRSIPGVFVDNEGDYGYKLAWSEDLAKHYKEKMGRDIRIWMPLLFDRDKEGKWARARWEWFEAVTDIYCDYLGSTSRWLEKKGMYCISNLWEESLMWQAGALGDFFKAQRSYSMPGTDCLGLSGLKVHDFKETQSVTEFESKRFQSEIMGAAGWWGFNPVSIKKMANAVTAWGVSHVVPHGIFMTRKLDGNPWLPDWYRENPMWPYLYHWTDFVRRASFINSHGHLSPEVLLLNPMDSVWALSGPGAFDPAIEGRVPVPPVMPLPSPSDTERSLKELKRNSAWWCPPRMNEWFCKKARQINSVYSSAMEDLTSNRIEYLVADRHYMKQMSIENGSLVRGKFCFKTVVMPPMLIVSLDTAAKLVEFARSGGHVYALGELPSGSTNFGMNDPVMKNLMKELCSYPTFKQCSKGLKSEIEDHSPGLLPQTIFESGAFAMIQQHRKIQGRDFFWLVNNSGKPQKSIVRVRNVSGGAFIWDCETGKTRQVCSEESRVALNFDPFEAYWLVFDPHTEPVPPAKTSKHEPETVLILRGKWQVNIDPSSQPPLEHPAKLPAVFTSKEGDTRSLQSWNKWELKRFSGYVDYRKSFRLKNIGGQVVLDLGKVYHLAAVWVNGKSAGSRLWPPFKFDISKLIKPDGENTIHIKVGNLVNNSYGQEQEAGLFGPVEIKRILLQ